MYKRQVLCRHGKRKAVDKKFTFLLVTLGGVAFQAVGTLAYDGDWKAGIAGPVKHAGIFDGEEYDAREPMGYECVDKLSTPEENTESVSYTHLDVYKRQR